MPLKLHLKQITSVVGQFEDPGLSCLPYLVHTKFMFWPENVFVRAWYTLFWERLSIKKIFLCTFSLEKHVLSLFSYSSLRFLKPIVKLIYPKLEACLSSIHYLCQLLTDICVLHPKLHLTAYLLSSTTKFCTDSKSFCSIMRNL